MSRKTEKRFHQEIDGQIVSVYFSRRFSHFKTFSGYSIREWWEIGAIVGNCRRANNDWYNGKRNSADNKMTGRIGIRSMLTIQSTIANFVNSSPSKITVIGIEGSDQKRQSCYLKMLNKAVKGLSCGHEIVMWEDGFAHLIVDKS